MSTLKKYRIDMVFQRNCNILFMNITYEKTFASHPKQKNSCVLQIKRRKTRGNDLYTIYCENKRFIRYKQSNSKTQEREITAVERKTGNGSPTHSKTAYKL